MCRPARCDQFCPGEINKVLITSRCVRECRLMGINPITGKNCDHRRAWLERRIERLILHFAIEVQAFSVLECELVITIRNRPDWVNSWNDEEAVYRWLMICPKRKNKLGEPREPKEEEILEILQNPRLIQEIRSRLSDPSWLMRLILQPLAARANLEENLTGNFWQGRYQSLVLLDDATALAASVFTDLASIQDDPQKKIGDSHFSSLRVRRECSLSTDCSNANSPFLCSMKRTESTLDIGSCFLSITLNEYIDLVEWTREGLALLAREDPKSREIAPHKILKEYRISLDLWFLMATEFDRVFYLFAGMPDVLLNYRRQNLNHRCHVRVEYRGFYVLAA